MPLLWVGPPQRSIFCGAGLWFYDHLRSST